MKTTQDVMAWYSHLSPQSLSQIHEFYADNAWFKDPFNEVRGINEIAAIFEHMFKTTQNPRFIFIEVIEQNHQAFLTWEFHFGLQGKTYVVNGGTHLHYDEQGLITQHRDYWDAAEELWQKLPVIGGLVRFLRGKFRVRQKY